MTFYFFSFFKMALALFLFLVLLKSMFLNETCVLIILINQKKVKMCKRLKKGYKDKFICMNIIFCILKTTRHSSVNVFIYITIKISLCHNSGITVCLHLWPYVLLPMIYIVHCFMLI